MTIAAESTQIFLDTFESAVDGVARGTQDMSQAFESMAKSIILQIGKLLATQGIGMFLSGQGGFLGDVGASLLANAKGNAFSDGNVVPFAKGGVVRGPTIFPMANGAGLMGEAGPEAVMPLSRDSRGRLGVSGGGMNVVVNNMAAGVEGGDPEADRRGADP
jgi:lambda family phage tail tape measure protein